jgi:hypothetical protein
MAVLDADCGCADVPLRTSSGCPVLLFAVATPDDPRASVDTTAAAVKIRANKRC